MISKVEQFKNLVKAGAYIIRSQEIIRTAFLTITEDDYELPDEAYDIYDAIDTTPFMLIVSSIAGVADSKYCTPDIVRILFADTVSLFVSQNQCADEYLETVCSIVFAGESLDNLVELEKQFNKKELHYIRNNF